MKNSNRMNPQDRSNQPKRDRDFLIDKSLHNYPSSPEGSRSDRPHRGDEPDPRQGRDKKGI